MQERAMGLQRPHIPYRNSLMTMVLRDSLGGNCKTRMIANINIAAQFLDESISTCRFAQRVAMISNKLSVNEETDPRLVIQRLKQEVWDLKAELQLLQVKVAFFHHSPGQQFRKYTSFAMY
jgi:kinesin family member 6/9